MNPRGVSPRRAVLAGLALLLVISATPVCEAQGPPRLETLEVALWPEYDRPAMLVTYRVALAPETPMPATVPLRIPTRVGVPHAVARRGDDDGLYLADYVREVGDEWATIRIATETRRIQLEYYAEIPSTGSTRDFTFVWPGGLDIGRFSYEVLEPRDCRGFQVSPPALQQRTGRDGALIHLAEFGRQASSQEVRISISYQRDSALRATAAPSDPAPTPPLPIAMSRNAMPQNAMPRNAMPRNAMPRNASAPGASRTSEGDTSGGRDVWTAAVIFLGAGLIVGILWLMARRPTSAGGE